MYLFHTCTFPPLYIAINIINSLYYLVLQLTLFASIENIKVRVKHEQHMLKIKKNIDIKIKKK